MAEQQTTLAKANGKAMKLRDPMALFKEMQEEMARFWQGGWPFTFQPFRMPFGDQETWMPTVDAFEKNGNLVVKAELPGVQKDDIALTLEGNDLVLRGERKTESEVKEEEYYRTERSYGSFYRRLPLPFEVQPEAITAAYTDGVLEVQIPKPAAAKPEAKEIKVG
jgi:HSP20 family protein